MKKQVRTIMCGCGECQLRKNASDTCPMATSKTAIQLWGSSSEEVDEAVSEIEIAQELQDAADEVEAEKLEVKF